ncbi:hypothetical protein WBK31_20315 [Nonomuraea sp. N2-4H]|uniref:hypothetical protein n=1 Tax=Nonomuraea sp. N2-4H TaxID=3128898 RepID=UPI00324876BA
MPRRRGRGELDLLVAARLMPAEPETDRARQVPVAHRGWVTASSVPGVPGPRVSPVRWVRRIRPSRRAPTLSVGVAAFRLRSVASPLC